MTSEEYARYVGKFMLGVARDFGVSREEYAYRRLFSMAATRIMFDGKDEYSEKDDTVQSVERKSSAMLVQDIEEEVTDLAAYASALAMKGDGYREECEELVFLSLQIMQVTENIRATWERNE